MNPKRATVAAVAAALGLLAIAYVWGPSKVPPGQAALLTLSSANSSEFQQAFDADVDAPRLVFLLSPT